MRTVIKDLLSKTDFKDRIFARPAASGTTLCEIPCKGTEFTISIKAHDWPAAEKPMRQYQVFLNNVAINSANRFVKEKWPEGVHSDGKILLKSFLVDNHLKHNIATLLENRLPSVGVRLAPENISRLIAATERDARMHKRNFLERFFDFDNTLPTPYKTLAQIPTNDGFSIVIKAYNHTDSETSKPKRCYALLLKAPNVIQRDRFVELCGEKPLHPDGYLLLHKPFVNNGLTAATVFRAIKRDLRKAGLLLPENTILNVITQDSKEQRQLSPNQR